jgi:hypothetical protein
MALFVGPKHSGKTCAACSWLDPNSKKKAKVHDFDARIRGLLGAPWIDRSRIDYDAFPPRDLNNPKPCFERVNQDLDLLLLTIKDPSRNPYELLVSDSATAFCKNLILDAIPLTHEKGGKRIGTMEMAGPADYGFESTGMDGYLSCLRSLPINVIMTAHIVDKFDKPVKDGVKDQYAESIIVGEKLSLRDKIGANISLYFDHVFKFSREVIGKDEKFYVEYVSNIACTSFYGLKPGRHDITGKNFREYTLGLLKQNEATQNIAK